jgi:hypothetical protein
MLSAARRFSRTGKQGGQVIVTLKQLALSPIAPAV